MILKESFDPCYGFKILPVGTKVIINKMSDGDTRMIWSDVEGRYPGFGYRLDAGMIR